MHSYHYEFDAHGNLVLKRDGESVFTIGATDEIALGYDKEDGTLMKHGRAAGVRDSIDAMRRSFARVGLHRIAQDLTVVAIPVRSVTRAVLEEINRCLEISDYVKRLPDRLAAIARAA